MPVAVGSSFALATVAKTRCLRGQANAALTVTNRERVPVDLTITTPWGIHTVSALAPGRSVTHFLNSRQRSFRAGTLTLSAQTGSPVSRAGRWSIAA